MYCESVYPRQLFWYMDKYKYDGSGDSSNLATKDRCHIALENEMIKQGARERR